MLFKKIKKLYKNYISKDHITLKCGSPNKSFIYQDNHILDLDRDWELSNSDYELLSYEGDKSNPITSDYPIIESWILKDGKSFTINEYFRESQSIKINYEKNLDKTEKNVKDKLYVIPFYTSHFGHFVGDILGSLIFYVQKFSDYSRKLLIICPSIEWENFFNENFKDKILTLKPKELVKNKINLHDAIVLPRMSTFQNIQLARSYFLSKNLGNKFYKKVFLTTERTERISNINELTMKLKELGFIIVNPLNLKITELMNYIKNSEILISEKASVLNNLLLVREKNFILLSCPEEKNLDSRFFAGAGIYKTFIINLINDIDCQKDPYNQNEKPYKNRIKVDIDKLVSILNDNEKN